MLCRKSFDINTLLLSMRVNFHFLSMFTFTLPITFSFLDHFAKKLIYFKMALAADGTNKPFIIFMFIFISSFTFWYTFTFPVFASRNSSV